MLEFLFVLYLLFFFIFPLPGLAATLGLATTYGLYGKYHLLCRQPALGRRLLAVHTLLAAVNVLCSAALAFLLALGVHLLIFGSPFLFIFNFIFCAAVSARWFDFTHAAYRRFALGEKHPPSPRPRNAAFVVCRGYLPGGMLGWLPAFLDAGLLHAGDAGLVFDGVFTRRALGPETVTAAGKRSLEKIRLTLRPPGGGSHAAEALTLTIKENFYPFRSRDTRNRLLKQLQSTPRASRVEPALPGA